MTKLSGAEAWSRSRMVRFLRTLDEYMRSKGQRAAAEDVLKAAEDMWRAREALRKLQPPLASVRSRPQPKRITSVVQGGLPGQNRRKYSSHIGDAC